MHGGEAAHLVFPLFYSVIVYKSSQRSKKVRLQHFFAPDKSTITCLVYTKGCLYVGLVSGSVAVYSRSQGVSHTSVGLCGFGAPRSLQTFVDPVKTAVITAGATLNHRHYWVSTETRSWRLLDLL